MTARPSHVLVFGAGGLLGRSVVTACEAQGVLVSGATRERCDISSAEEVLQLCRETDADLIINAAAATDVDRCELEPEYAWRANTLGPRVLAQAAAQTGAHLVHISTDYVFPGDGGAPYNELASPAPGTVYGQSKLAGEQAVLSTLAKGVVIRTSWLFGPGGRNFVSHMPNLLKRRGALAAVADQWSSPTNAADLADWLLDHAKLATGGVYHVVNPDRVSYFEVGLLTARCLGLEESVVSPAPSVALARPATRPTDSALTSIALPAEGLPPLRSFPEAYASFVAELFP